MKNPFRTRTTVADVMKPFQTALNELTSIAENRIALAEAADQQAEALKVQAKSDRAESDAAIAMHRNLSKMFE